MIRVGLVEDNLDFRAEVAFHLRRAGFEVALENNGIDIDAQLAAQPCDLLVLDLGLPVEDGLVIAHRLRQRQPGLGIVMLTARGKLDDRLSGMAEGADAYLVKPVDMRELVATLQAVQRRLTSTAAPQTPAEGWVVMASTLSMQTPGGALVTVTVSELDLLICLAHAAPNPVSREALAAAIGHAEPDFDDRRLEVAFSRLRKKIITAHPGDIPLRSARNRGYVFAASIRVIEP